MLEPNNVEQKGKERPFAAQRVEQNEHSTAWQEQEIEKFSHILLNELNVHMTQVMANRMGAFRNKWAQDDDETGAEKKNIEWVYVLI